MPLSKPLPAELDPSARQLVTDLRRLRDHSELTMRQLATKTGYSAKSWERYLGGTSLPPREAVEALARITATDPVPLLALREIAVETWGDRRTRAGAAKEQGRVEQASPAREERPQPEGEGWKERPQPEREGAPAHPAPGRFPHLALTVGVAALVVALLSALLLVLRLDDDATPAAITAAPRSAAPSPPPSYTCHITRVQGRWSAGINKGRNTEIGYGDSGADVAEAQCLLRRAGISPGGIDGMFGPLTLRAAKTFQQREGLTVDGMLGPHSWKALRG
ncbi:peptidoglycan-binding protein [Streptomyces griseorubiginosus]|uniref:peptidoglycan-binding protein n=1 Tax=Streptomyces griseorubiginosus TaxID=67304 RepID=UPI00113FFD80|nr:peptidoglycan-binding protein [Streptomyces griseorubiginosus]